VIAGTDIAGMLCDGTFEITPDGFVLGRVKYVLPVGSSTITGLSATDEPIELISPLKLPLVFANDTFTASRHPLAP
jgi:hypothetical protein